MHIVSADVRQRTSTAEMLICWIRQQMARAYVAHGLKLRPAFRSQCFACGHRNPGIALDSGKAESLLFCAAVYKMPYYLYWHLSSWLGRAQMPKTKH